jgi:hypothetical protein
MLVNRAALSLEKIVTQSDSIIIVVATSRPQAHCPQRQRLFVSKTVVLQKMNRDVKSPSCAPIYTHKEPITYQFSVEIFR